MKDVEVIPEYEIGEYSGMAIRVSGGVEAWELYPYMVKYNMTVVMPGWSTVSAVGGWMASGGHGVLASSHGLGSDQVLSIEVVTADGRVVTADPFSNEDLFWALRGGGGATYGVVTSVVYRTHPPVTLTSTSLSFQYDPHALPNSTVPGTYNIKDLETFWKGVNIYYLFANKVTHAGGFGFSYVYPNTLSNGSFSFTTSNRLINMSPADSLTFHQPLYDAFDAAGINITKPTFLPPATIYGNQRPSNIGDKPNNLRYTSRLFPSAHWLDEPLFEADMSAIRSAIEAGYTFHGTLASPLASTAGWPGSNSAINPAWRVGTMHAMLFYKDQSLTIQSASQATAASQDINKYIKNWQKLTPGGGAYMNEADPADPDWQQSFYGSNYERLDEVKRDVDPWGVFWAETTVGSERWEVRTEDGFPFGQNGRLCRTVR